jgi:hypothetical protein
MVSDEAVHVSVGLAALLEEEYRLGLSQPPTIYPSAPPTSIRVPPHPRPVPTAPPETVQREAPPQEEPVGPLVVPNPAPEAFRHRWGRTAVREAVLFLALAAMVLPVCGLFLPISWDVYWLLIGLVFGIGAAIAVGIYLFNVLPRLLIAVIVRRYGDMPEAHRLKWEQSAFGFGFTCSVATFGLLALFLLPRNPWEFLAVLMVGAVAGLFGGLCCYCAVITWNSLVGVILRRYTLTRPKEARPEGYADSTEVPRDDESEFDFPPLADTDIISDRRPRRANRPATDIQPGEPR